MKLTSFTARAAVAGLASIPVVAMAQKADKSRLNVVLITADDLNCSTTPMFGCKVPDLMPNIEKLSREGMLFKRGYIVSGASQVSRGGIMTGLYPHNSGIDGFYHTDKNIPTFQETLQANGYRIGIICKVTHSTPKADIKWDFAIDDKEAHYGRDGKIFYDNMVAFIGKAKKEGRPFFFMANSRDPHRPWAGSKQEMDAKAKGQSRNYPDPKRIYRPDEVEVPGFIPDLPNIRIETAQYFSSVHRLDETVGSVMQAIHDAGVDSNTMVIFLSDNGMSMPFSKTNSYLHSCHTPLIVKLPGVVKPGSVDEEHFVNGIDFMPTVFEALGIPIPSTLDGRSYYALLQGKKQDGWDYLYTEFTENSGRNREPIRAVQDAKYGYIYNVWSDHVRQFKSETMAGLTWPAMKKAAETDSEIAARCDLFLYRVPEEFYDYEKDPDALHNLVNDPNYKTEVDKFRAILEKHMVETNDPVLAPFKSRNNKAVVEKYMTNQDAIVKARMAAAKASGGGAKKSKKGKGGGAKEDDGE